MDSAIAAALRARLGDDAVGADTAAYQVTGREPSCVVRPTSVAQVSEVMAMAHEQRWAVLPVGNATHLHVGAPPTRYDVAVCLTRLNRIVAHEAADMTVTAEAGVTLGALNESLAAAGQWLPLDPPCVDRVTVGGAIAGDLNGPMRLSQGKVRDLLIGITVVLADGTVVKGGGRVVKNVAGYDLSKLFTGSHGTLGLIVEATFKLRPRPAHSRVAWIAAASLKDAAERAVAALDSHIAPLFVEVVDAAAAAKLGRDGAGAVMGLAGSREEIDAQHAVLLQRYGDAVRLCDEDDGLQMTAWLREFPHNAAPQMSARVSLLPTQLATLLPRIGPEAVARDVAVTMVAHAGNGVARVSVTTSEETAAVLLAEWLRLAARELGGWVVFDRLPDALHGRVDPFGNSTAAVRLMRGVKQQLDPQGILSPGRFVGGI